MIIRNRTTKFTLFLIKFLGKHLEMSVKMTIFVSHL